MEMYFVYVLDCCGYVKGEKRVTDKEHLEKCIEMVKHDLRATSVHVNKAHFCFDGYLVQGDYIGRR